MGIRSNITKFLAKFFGVASSPVASPPRMGTSSPGEIFTWPKGWKITALDDSVLAIPSAILSDNEIIGNVIHAEDDVMLRLPTGVDPVSDAHILIHLKEGQSVFLSKSCQALVVSNYEGTKL